MRTIDMQTWSRQNHFKLFSSYGYPHWGICANIDLTAFYPAVKQRGQSFTIAMVYLISRAANAIPEFRYRIQEDKVVEHDVVNPGFTFLTEEDTFSFCFADYDEDFSAFAVHVAERIAFVKENPGVPTIPEDDVLYMTSIPWVSFTGFLHPMRLQPEELHTTICVGKILPGRRSSKNSAGCSGASCAHGWVTRWKIL